MSSPLLSDPKASRFPSRDLSSSPPRNLPTQAQRRLATSESLLTSRYRSGQSGSSLWPKGRCTPVLGRCLSRVEGSVLHERRYLDHAFLPPICHPLGSLFLESVVKIRHRDHLTRLEIGISVPRTIAEHIRPQTLPLHLFRSRSGEAVPIRERNRCRGKV
jgi:hypothetical protein